MQRRPAGRRLLSEYISQVTGHLFDGFVIRTNTNPCRSFSDLALLPFFLLRAMAHNYGLSSTSLFLCAKCEFQLIFTPGIFILLLLPPRLSERFEKRGRYPWTAAIESGISGTMRTTARVRSKDDGDARGYDDVPVATRWQSYAQRKYTRIGADSVPTR